MISLFITALLVLFIAGVVVYLLSQAPMDPAFFQIIRAVAIVGAILYVLGVFGLIPGFTFPHLRF